jgi:uncharacterized damage-inducible protein DinB
MPDNLESLRRDLHAGRERLLAVVAGVTEEQFKRRPPAEPDATGPVWSIAEVLAHLLQQERLRAERIAMALDHEGAKVVPSTDEEHYEAARAGRASPVPQLIHGLLASRREIERLLEQAVSQEDGLERAVLHPQLGRQTVAWIIREKVIAHEEEHAQQIEAIKVALAEAKEAAR